LSSFIKAVTTITVQELSIDIQYMIFIEKEKYAVQTSLDKCVYKSDKEDPVPSTYAESEPKIIEQ
jgi:hypothetical protein